MTVCIKSPGVARLRRGGMQIWIITIVCLSLLAGRAYAHGLGTHRLQHPEVSHTLARTSLTLYIDGARAA